MNPLPRVRLTIEFDGAPFAGWQRQDGDRSVQEELERALAKVFKAKITLHGAGRTDAGVHAMGMVAHFDAPTAMPFERLPLAIRPYLPPEISVTAAAEASPHFDARRDALLRWYRFQIDRRGEPHPLGARAWRVYGELDVTAMARAVALLEGWHDFQGFRSIKCKVERTRLHMRQASLTESPPLLVLDFKCQSFLQRMVRLMTGALVEIGRGRLSEAKFARILETGQRPDPVPAAPPGGLCLMAIAYEPAEFESVLTVNPPAPNF